MCAAFHDAGALTLDPGIYLTDTAGIYRSFIGNGFGPDWNPTRN
jgi:hypothetical protein